MGDAVTDLGASPDTSPHTSPGGDPGTAVNGPARRSWLALVELLRRSEVHESVAAGVAALDLPGPGPLRALLGLTDDPAPMGTLKDAMQCDASYVTSLVDVLEDRGYVERRLSTADRRVKLVVLTDQGRAAQRTARTLMSVPPDALAALPEPDARRLADLLERVVEVLSAADRGRSDR